MNRPARGKILSLDDTVKLCEQARKENKKIVFTNGCFDIIHAGHIEYLEEARGLGDLLIVGINTDASVKRLKEKGRPINEMSDRAAVVAALESVDVVCLFNEDTPAKLINAVMPDILVKGAEYRIEDIVGRKQVLSGGGKVVPIPMIPGKSTSAIIKKIKELLD